jgi:Holliday junction resolvase
MLQETDVNCKEQLSKRGRHSRNKGKRGEREVAKILQTAGFPARRTVQYNGRAGTADVVGVPGMHIEVKFVEKESVRTWYKQAERDAEASSEQEIPVVVHRKSREPWLVTLSLANFIKIIKLRGD